MRRILISLAIAIPTLVMSACGSDGDDGGDDGVDPPDASNPGTPDASNPGTPDAPPSACADLAGSWAISGACGADLCMISQAGCAITAVSCVSGSESTSGSINGNAFSYTGTSGGGVPSTCTGTASGNTIAGTCTVTGAGSCAFSGNRQ